jgi:hypothetical protein
MNFANQVAAIAAPIVKIERIPDPETAELVRQGP